MADPFFAYLPGDGCDWDLTASAAELAARSYLAADEDAAAADGTWPDDTGSIRMGVVLAQVVEHRVPGRCPECGCVGEHEPDCLEMGDEPAYDYTLEPVPGAVEAVLGLATVEQLQAELRRRWVAAAVHG